VICARQGCFRVLAAAGPSESGRRRKTSSYAERTLLRLKRGAPVMRAAWPYFGGAGVKTSRLWAGSGLGFGLGAFLASFLPLSLLPMAASVPQTPAFRQGFIDSGFASGHFCFPRGCEYGMMGNTSQVIETRRLCHDD